MLRVRNLIGAAAIASAAAAVQADTAVLTPVKDNTLYQSRGGELSNGQGANLFAGVTSSGSIRRALLAFDVSSIPAGSTVTSATLSLNLNRSAAFGENMTVHRVLASWGEGVSNAGEPGGAGTAAAIGDASWNYRFYSSIPWSTPGGDFVPDASATASITDVSVVYTWGSTVQLVADVQGWVTQPASNFGWLLQGDESALGGATRYDSREGTTVPTLTVTFTPPSACGSADFNCDGDVGTDADIEAFFACLAGTCPAPPCTNSADFNGDGDIGTDADIEAFFRVLGGGAC